MAAAVLVLAPAATAEKAKAPVERKQARSQVEQKTSVSLIARVKAPKPVSSMSLQETERFQVKALSHYTGMWRTWLKIKPTYRTEDLPSSGQWIMTRCQGAKAPVWACWNLQAKGWTKFELVKTRKKIYIRDHTIPSNLDWLQSIKWVQRIYPGTFDWLYSISDREGCNRVEVCPWVWYGSQPWRGSHVGNDFLGADTVGGPLQFRYSTFAPYWRHAQENLRSLGYIVPTFKMPPEGGDVRYAAWLHPMGQALTGGYMKWAGREGCHWCLN
jgi:hypothetical protein